MQNSLEQYLNGQLDLLRKWMIQFWLSRTISQCSKILVLSTLILNIQHGLISIDSTLTRMSYNIINDISVRWSILDQRRLTICRMTFITIINPFIPKTPFLYHLKTSDNLTIFWCFQGVEKGCIGNEWVNIFVRRSTMD